ncbi:IS200/IS605 family transposase [Endozoicomonas numazuensis]|uniref:Cytosine methyltransferase n=1 Tax=Endozoicomonas numazuensis TaxID=1137799 RepID=A0A081NJM9_9GAMM|nr:IS200/IS605 family transposase [Endozoicomonas numazuensis]KEQ18652.1 cytosine methyltransferase [Endozoicomonas numazuensis]
MQEIKKGRHSAYSLHCHIVFVTKYRKKVLGALHLTRLKDIFSEICGSFDSELVEFNGEADHVHLLVEFTPKTPSISKPINSLKAVSSRRLRQEFCDIAGAYRKPVLWSRSYFAGSCGGAPLDVIKEYIENQDQP